VLAVLLESTRIGHPALGVILPMSILLLSFVLTYLLIKFFSKRNSE
jgi:hypothetical protein